MVSDSVAGAEPIGHDAEPGPVWRYDLRPGLPALSAFPAGRVAGRDQGRAGGLSDADLGYPDPGRAAALRTELAAYLGRVRAVAGTAADIVVTNGAAEGTTLLAQVLRADGDIGGSPWRTLSHPGQAELFATHGLTPVPLPVDEDGLVVDTLAAPAAGSSWPPRRTSSRSVSPCTHAPLALLDLGNGGRRPDHRGRLRRRAPLRHGPMSALQALDPEQVVYQGSASKTLAPALRIGWLVAPAALRAKLADRKRLHDLGGSPLPHAAMAHLLATGGYDRHLRGARQLYRQRRDALLDRTRRTPAGLATGRRGRRTARRGPPARKHRRPGDIRRTGRAWRQRARPVELLPPRARHRPIRVSSSATPCSARTGCGPPSPKWRELSAAGGTMGDVLFSDVVPRPPPWRPPGPGWPRWTPWPAPSAPPIRAEVPAVVGFLVGQPRQGRIGTGWRTLVKLAVATGRHADADRGRRRRRRWPRSPRPAGAGSAAAKATLLTGLLGRATKVEHDFLLRLLTGELRQGALEGVMVDAVAKAAERARRDARDGRSCCPAR